MTWQPPPADLADHVVICNCSPKVRRIVAELQAPTVVYRPDVVLVIQDPALWEANPDWQPDPNDDYAAGHFFTVLDERGSANPEVLRSAGVELARTAVILADPRQGQRADARSTLVALAIERINSDVHTVMELISSVNRVHLRRTKVDEVVCTGELAERLVAQSCITPGIKNVVQSLLVNQPKTNNIYLLPLPGSLVDSSYRQLVTRAIESRAPFLICGYVRNSFLPLASPRPGDRPDEERDPSTEFDDFDPTNPDVFGTEESGLRPLDAEPDRDFVINPRSGEEPGRDTPLTVNDQLVVMAYERPVVERWLKTASD